jgi:hypothetical protein
MESPALFTHKPLSAQIMAAGVKHSDYHHAAFVETLGPQGSQHPRDCTQGVQAALDTWAEEIAIKALGPRSITAGQMGVLGSVTAYMREPTEAELQLPTVEILRRALGDLTSPMKWTTLPDECDKIIFKDSPRLVAVQIATYIFGGPVPKQLEELTRAFSTLPGARSGNSQFYGHHCFHAHRGVLHYGAFASAESFHPAHLKPHGIAFAEPGMIEYVPTASHSVMFPHF